MITVLSGVCKNRELNLLPHPPISIQQFLRPAILIDRIRLPVVRLAGRALVTWRARGINAFFRSRDSCRCLSNGYDFAMSVEKRGNDRLFTFGSGEGLIQPRVECDNLPSMRRQLDRDSHRVRDKRKKYAD